MASDDWCRNSEWSADIEAAFNAKLMRARNKSSYLRIQASHLASSHPDVALRLVERGLENAERWDAVNLLDVQASAWLALGETESALGSLRKAVALRYVERPKIVSRADLRFARIVASGRIVELYSEALAMLDARAADASGLVLPDFRYELHGSRALILERVSEPEQARQEAVKAMEAAGERASGLPSHAGIGLVKATDDDFGRQVRFLAFGPEAGSAH